MLLRKPEAYVPDPGRSLPPEELEVAAKEVTHVSQIVSKSCKLEFPNRVHPKNWGRG